jgi:hypothetical protein
MNHLSFIDELVLLGMKGGGQKGLTASDVGKALKPVLDRRKSELTATLQRLSELERIEEIPRQKGQRSKRWRLRESGSETTKPRAGGRSARQKAIRRLVAAHTLNLDPRGAETAAQGDGIFAYYLSARLGEVFDANTTVKGLAGLVTARELDLSRADPDLAWERLIQKELEGKEAVKPFTAPDVPLAGSPSASTDDQRSDVPQDDVEPVSIALFAEQVKQAARTAKDGWFGPRKLFIHRAWEAWKAHSAESANLPEFKQRLLQALRAGQIELSRADFPRGLESTDLQNALTQYGDETFHFVTLDEEAPL